MSAPEPMYRLVSTQLMRTLMQRTGTGAPISVRDLATAAGVSRSTVGVLLTGEQASLPAQKAHAIAEAIGVDVLVLFEPVGRATSAGGPEMRVVSA